MSGVAATSLGPVSQIGAGVLEVGYVEAGPGDGPAVLLLHGWPYDIHSYEEVTPRLAAAGCRVIVPYLRRFGSTRFRSDETARNDHVDVVIHNYRWRLGLAEGEPEYAELELRLAEGPGITVPTITLEGDSNGAPHPEPSAYASKFSGPYSHRTIEGGVGHNLPEEAPEVFAEAVLELGGTA